MTSIRFFAVPALAASLWTGLPTLATAQIYVQVAPPPVIYEVVPARRHGYIWVEGHYEWRRGRYVWIPGYWVRERRGYVYTQPYWEQRGSRWVYYGGAWVPQARYYDGRDGRRRHWDRDGDGVPDRFDARPDNPYRR